MLTPLGPQPLQPWFSSDHSEQVSPLYLLTCVGSLPQTRSTPLLKDFVVVVLKPNSAHSEEYTQWLLKGDNKGLHML